MKCPYCGEEMELGYIQCRDGVYWRKKKGLIAAVPPLGSASIALATDGGPFSGAAAEAYRCAGCEKIIIDCSSQGSGM